MRDKPSAFVPHEQDYGRRGGFSLMISLFPQKKGPNIFYYASIILPASSVTLPAPRTSNTS